MIRKDLKEQYSPLYFLASLGAGGVTVTFFLYPMFMVEHSDTPLVAFHHIIPLIANGNPVISALLTGSLLLMAVFAILHVKLLIWNITEYRRFKATQAFSRLKTSNQEVSLMAIPLTLAMGVNVSFILASVFIPNLWTVAEYLFPLAILVFLGIGSYALKIFSEYMTRLLTVGDFDFIANNNLGQMIAIFAFAMVGVGLAAPGAMSHIKVINAIAIFFSLLFTSIAVLLGMVKLTLGFKSMLRQGISPSSSPSLWITIPILTLLGITMIRLSFGLDHGFDQPISRPNLFILTSIILSLQIVFGILGYSVMRKLGYFQDYIHGDKKHVGSYALVCPGVALFVFGMFFITFGLVKNDVIEKFSLAYFMLLAPFVIVQIKTVLTLVKLNRRLLRQPPAPPVPLAAEG